MNPNERDLLQKTHDLAEDNNRILRGIRRSNRWSTFFRAIYWIIIIGVSIGAFYYIQPYVDTLLKTYQSLQGSIQNIQTTTNKIPGLIK